METCVPREFALPLPPGFGGNDALSHDRTGQSRPGIARSGEPAPTLWEAHMHGLMQDQPLLISSLITYADRHHGKTEIVSRMIEGPIHRYTYRDAHARARKLANALTRLGVNEADRIGTLAWNTFRHFEIYYAVSGMGAVCHTINPRLFAEQIVYII